MRMSDAEKQRRYQQRKRKAIERLPKIACLCGCGTMVPPINRRGEVAKYAHGHNPAPDHTLFQPGHNQGGLGVEARKAKGIYEGENHPNWKSGQFVDKRGYVRVRICREQAAIWPTHRSSGCGFTIMRSHQVWNETHPDDIVQRGEQIHHADKNTSNDVPDNLQKVSKTLHDTLHLKDRQQRPRNPVTGRYF